jgi:hypothetical protein
LLANLMRTLAVARFTLRIFCSGLVRTDRIRWALKFAHFIKHFVGKKS